jgi:hypothetical protein
MYGRVKATLERRGTQIEDVDAAIAAHALALDASAINVHGRGAASPFRIIVIGLV